MSNPKVITHEELYKILESIPNDFTIDVAALWSKKSHNPDEYYAEEWYGIKKISPFDGIDPCILIGFWGGGKEDIFPFDEDFSHYFSEYVKDWMEGTAEEGKICLDFNSLPKA